MDARDPAALESTIDLLKGAVEMFGGTVKQTLDEEVTHCVCYISGASDENTFADIMSRYNSLL